MSERLQEAIAHHRAGRLAEAERLYRLALEASPKNAIVHGLIGDVLQALARDDDAVAAYRAALRLNPDLPTVQVNLGLSLRRLGEFEQALEALRGAAERYPTLPEAHLNLGLIWQDLQRFDEAILAYRKALELRPDYGEAYLNLGSAYYSRGQEAEARAAYEAALKLRPDYPEVLYSLGVIRQDSGDIDGAVEAYRRALALRPAYAECRDNLAYALQVLGCYGEAAELYRRGIREGPGPENAARYLSLVSLYDPDADPVARYAEQRQAAERFARPLYARIAPHANPRDPDRKLRIGYLTSDFRDHPIGRNVEPLLAHRDRGKFEVIAYADIPKPDAMTDHLRRLVDGWRWVTRFTDERVAELVRRDGIDVLVLLAGHFDRNRPLVCAYRPAPIQISFHDLITTGLDTVDYFIADRTVYPRGALERFTERVIRLPSLYVHAPLVPLPIGPLPCRQSGVVTFGSFNNPAKVNDLVLQLWAQILRAAPSAQLILKFRNWFLVPSIQARIAAAMASAGVDGARVRFGGHRESREDHLARYAEVDVALDPFPFSGSTTSFEALWMGVPVVTLAGATIASRWSASMLRAARLEELIADTPERYVALAASLAGDPARLERLHFSLRDRVVRSPLTNGSLRARQIERVYRAVWRRWCAGPRMPTSG